MSYTIIRISSTRDAKKLIEKDPRLSFDAFASDLECDLEDPDELRHAAGYPPIINELRILCTMAMLLCLDHKYRMASLLSHKLYNLINTRTLAPLARFEEQGKHSRPGCA